MIADIGYRNKFNHTNWGIGIQYKHIIPFHLMLSTDIIAYVPDNGGTGLDVGVNLQYRLNLHKNMTIYPFVGGVASNHLFGTGDLPDSDSDGLRVTDFGFIFGIGAEYNISRRDFVNIDFKYNLIDKGKHAWYEDYGLVRVGYGFRF
jgi:opacity protein-like surface antigen